MQAINTYLAVANIRASMTFLEQALGFSPGVVLLDPEKQPRYAEMRRQGAVVMLTRKGDVTVPGGGAAALYTYVEDVDRALVGAREAGAGVSDAENTPWGDRTALVIDPDGYRWVLATFKKLVPFSPGG
jgi:PhnB protein